MKNKPQSETKNIIRHAILNALRSHNLKYRRDYGDMVIACDGRNYWRRTFFPAYKGLRKKARDESDLDWGFIHECLHEIREDLAKYFPYRVIRHDRAEADDVGIGRRVAHLLHRRQGLRPHVVGVFTEVVAR